MTHVSNQHKIHTIMPVERNLWSQVETLEGPQGSRLSGESEVLHEIQDFFSSQGVPISRIQIQIILESVPEVFPEDWKNPESFDQLSELQKEIGLKISDANPKVPIYGDMVQKIIEEAILYRDRFTV